MGYTIPDEAGFEIDGYEYGVEYYADNFNPPVWRMAITNHFRGWYPAEKNAKNALAQLRAHSYGRPPLYEYRMVRRPFGALEVVE